MEARWSINSNPLDEAGHLSAAEVANPPQRNGTYYGFFYDDTNKCSSSTISVELTLNAIPTIADTMGDERCGPGEVTLTVKGAPDAEINHPLLIGMTVQRAVMGLLVQVKYSLGYSATTSYYVEASANGCVSERQEVVATVYPFPRQVHLLMHRHVALRQMGRPLLILMI